MTDFIRQNLEKLIDDRGEDMKFLSTNVLQKNHSYIFGFLKRGAPQSLSEKSRWQLVNYFNVPPITFFTDEELQLLSYRADPSERTPSRGFQSAPYSGIWAGVDKIPVVAYAAASGERVAINLEHDAPVRMIERPHWLAGVPKAVAVQIIGESMIPRYRDGEVVFVNMSMPPAKGKDCIFNTRDGFTHIKQFLKADKEFYYFHQWNPDTEFNIHRRDIENIYQIVGRE